MEPAHNSNTEILLSAESLGVQYMKEWIIRDFNFSITRGEIITFVGPNGGGKTTTIKTLLGIITPCVGNIKKKHNLRIGYVPQIKAISPYLPLRVSYFLQLFAKDKQTDISSLLDMVGIAGLENKQVNHLSGGEFQRMFLAQALLNSPDLLVLDEPTQGIDFRGEIEFYKLINNLCDKFQCAIILVTHNLHFVMAQSKKVLCINGHICCEGSPQSLVDNHHFRKIFGDENIDTIAMYAHKHDHDHHGRVITKDV